MLIGSGLRDDDALQILELVASIAWGRTAAARRPIFSSTGGDGLLYCFATN